MDNNSVGLNRFKILIAEDVAMLRLQMTKALTHFGFEVQAVADGDGVVSALSFQRERFFCLLLDLNLPGMSGEEILRWMANNKIDLPVIVCSGALSREKILFITQLYGITHIFPKPFDYDVLRKKLLGIYPTHKMGLFVSAKNETMFLMQSFFDYNVLRFIWGPNFINIHTEDEVKIFYFGMMDRDFRETIDSIDWSAVTGLKYLMGNKKVVEYGESFSGVFDGVFALPFDFPEICSIIKQALFPPAAVPEKKEENPTEASDPVKKALDNED